MSKKQTVFGFSDNRTDDKCVCCGDYVPEGRQVCLSCEKKAGTGLMRSESLIIGFDMSNGVDKSALSVVRISGSKHVYLNTFYGEEAEWMYSRLTNIKI
jgi:hypothetical protein